MVTLFDGNLRNFIVPFKTNCSNKYISHKLTLSSSAGRVLMSNRSPKQLKRDMVLKLSPWRSKTTIPIPVQAIELLRTRKIGSKVRESFGRTWLRNSTFLLKLVVFDILSRKLSNNRALFAVSVESVKYKILSFVWCCCAVVDFVRMMVAHCSRKNKCRS